MVWQPGGDKYNEAAKVKYDIVKYTRGRGLDLGCGRWKAFPHFIGMDQKCDFCEGETAHALGCPAATSINIFGDCSDLRMFGDYSLDFIFSSHVLEDMEDTEGALKEWWRKIKVGGYLVLYLPHKSFYPNVGDPEGNKDHKHDFHPADIIKKMAYISNEFLLCGWDLLVCEDRNEGNEYSFLQVYQKRVDASLEHEWRRKKPKKTCAIIRYGGIGDMIQASSIIPGLKSQGYHVTFYTTPTGREILKHDPFIDDFYIQDTDQVPNMELQAFWKHHAKKFTKFINLSESVEGTFLAMPGRPNHSWPHDVRGAMLNRNYLEFTHLLAGVPLPPKQRFYPSAEEKKWARKEKQKIGEKVIVWSLSGSSPHKAWPYLDQIVARIMITPDMADWKVVFVGGQLDQILEMGWENEARVIRKCGRWSVRESLNFALVADIIIGSETGIMNAVGMEDMPKIITLSHSSQENLTKYWKNTIVLEPDDCSCYPCHQLHYSFEYCSVDRNEDGALAECQVKTDPEKLWDAILSHLQDMKGRFK